MFTGMIDEVVQKRCVPTPRQTRIRLMAMGAWWMDYSMAVGIQWTRIRQMVVGTRCSGDNLDTEANNKNAADGDQTDG